MSPIPLQQQYNALADHPAFQSRVRAAMNRTALDVLAESPDSEGRIARTQLATRCLAPQDTANAGFAPAVASHPDVLAAAAAAPAGTADADLQAAVSDTVLLATVRKLWDVFAGRIETSQPTSTMPPMMGG